MTFTDLLIEYWKTPFDEEEAQEMVGSKCRVTTVQELSLLWGFKRACELAGLNPQDVIQGKEDLDL